MCQSAYTNAHAGFYFLRRRPSPSPSASWSHDSLRPGEHCERGSFRPAVCSRRAADVAASLRQVLWFCEPPEPAAQFLMLRPGLNLAAELVWFQFPHGFRDLVATSLNRPELNTFLHGVWKIRQNFGPHQILLKHIFK